MWCRLFAVGSRIWDSGNGGNHSVVKICLHALIEIDLHALIISID